VVEISIIIPTLNRANTLRITLDSILNQRDLSNLEVIVVDNGSTDGTANLCKDFIDDQKLNLQYHYDSEPGLLTGRHLGSSVAKGNILCFIDDDVELYATWQQGVVDAFSDEEVKLATGPSLPKYEINPPDWLQYFWKDINGGKSCDWLSLIDLGEEKKVINATSVWGLNFCIRKETFIALGGFHPDNVTAQFQIYQGDGETGLTLKAAALNYKSIYHPAIKVHHLISHERLQIEYFKRRAFYQGVCNSFTSLRKKNLDMIEDSNVSKLKKMLSPIKQAIEDFRKKKIPPEVEELMEILKQEEKSGFQFHEHAFKFDEKVKQWVLKKDYWDYRLPV
jgi:glycosyltransferase involved in cell wall biosynthesis